MKFLLHPEADVEFAGAVRYYSEISSELGIRFYREIERLFSDVGNHPERFRIFDPPARRHVSRDFPYAIIFTEKSGYLCIVAVMHLKRRPGYWRGRIG